MKTIEVGAFEAKTNFSRLLRDVEQGAEVRITRHGRPIAVLRAVETDQIEAQEQALRRIAARRSHLTAGEVLDLRDQGRTR